MKQKKKELPKLKFVVTHIDDLIVHFTVWEWTFNEFICCGSLCMRTETYEQLWKILNGLGMNFPTELKTEVNDDDTPTYPTAQERNIQAEQARNERVSRNSLRTDEQRSDSEAESSGEGREGHTKGGNDYLEYGG